MVEPCFFRGGGSGFGDPGPRSLTRKPFTFLLVGCTVLEELAAVVLLAVQPHHRRHLGVGSLFKINYLAEM